MSFVKVLYLSLVCLLLDLFLNGLDIFLLLQYIFNTILLFNWLSVIFSDEFVSVYVCLYNID